MMNVQLNGDLMRLLEIKKELLAKLLNAVNRAAECLRQEDMDAFSLEMEKCKNITALVDETGAAGNQLRQQISDPQQHPELTRLESDIAYICAEIERARRECNDIAEQQLKTYGQQIRAIRHTQKGIGGYVSQLNTREAFFVDAKK
jgi:chromosome segregation ATPase